MMTRRFFILLILICGTASCQRSNEAFTSGQGHRFTIKVAQYEDTLSVDEYGNGALSRASNVVLTQLKAGIYDSQGALWDDCTVVLSEDLTQVTVHGLVNGDYTAVFIGIGQQQSLVAPTLKLPRRIDDPWLPGQDKGVPLNDEYLYAKSTLKVLDGQVTSSAVMLRRIVGRVDIESTSSGSPIAGASPMNVLISFSDQAFYTTHLANGSYGGKGSIEAFDATEPLGFYTLPTIGSAARKGTVTLTWVLNDNTPYRETFDFDLIIKPNKRSVIRLSYQNNQDKFGTVRVYDKQRDAKNSTKFFQDPTAKYHGYKEIASHSFKLSELLNIRFENGVMRARFYSLIGVRDVTVYAKRPSDSEFFEVAWFESIQALEQRSVSLPSSMDNRLYRSESGGFIFIDKLGDQLSYKYTSSDEHMKKLASVKWPLRVSFKQPVGADTTSTNAQDLPLRAVHAREAVALWSNVAFMYSHPSWQEAMLGAQAQTPFSENGVSISLQEVFFPQIFKDKAENSVILNIYNVAGALPGNSTAAGALGLRQLIYNDLQYTDSSDPRAAYPYGPIQYTRRLGYGDAGDFAAGRSVDINKAFFQSHALSLPYPSAWLLNSSANPNLYTGLKGWS